MKLIMIIILSLSFIGVLISSNAYAGKEVCPIDTVHCAYFDGNFTKGRWIRVNGTVNFIYCFKQANYVSIHSSSAEPRLGSNRDHYAICADEYGKNCKSLGIDNFTITSKNDFFHSNPKYYAIDMSQIADQYPACGH